MATNIKVKTKGGTEYGYFRITKTIGHKYVNGRKTPVRKIFYGSSKKNAEKKYEEWKEMQYKKQTQIVNDTTTFGELMDYYCENVLMVNSKYQITTREQYKEAYCRYLKTNAITSIPIRELQSSDIQNFYNKTNTSKTSMTKLHCFTKGFFTWASSNNYCNSILDSVVVPDKNIKKQNDDIVYWTEEEIKQIMESEPNYKYKPLLIFALYSGMRISELLGLKWDDIYNDIIHVRRQYCRGHWKNPKNEEKRDIPMHKKIKEYVNEADHKYELVFASDDGEPLIYTTVMNNICRFYKRNKIPHKKFHAYRATFCTNLCRKDVPIQTIAKLAGHKSIEVTAQYYAAISIDEKTDAISRL